jgi:hypothetical protein
LIQIPVAGGPLSSRPTHQDPEDVLPESVQAPRPADQDLALLARPELRPVRSLLDADELSLFTFAESAEETWTSIVGWYTDRGRSLFDEPGEVFHGSLACD